MRKMKFQAIALHEMDNVGVLLVDVQENVKVVVGGQRSLQVVARDDICFGHKIALMDIEEGGTVRKYGHPIGLASQNIRMGEHVHIHNVRGLRAGT